MQERYEKLLTQVQEFLKEHAAIVEDAPVALTEEKDPKKLHERLVRRSEALYKLNVAIRTEFGDLTKLCIGVDGSIADRAVTRRRELFGEKETVQETKDAEPKVEAKQPVTNGNPKSQQRVKAGK
jgi:hypothetical protein